MAPLLLTQCGRSQRGCEIRGISTIPYLHVRLGARNRAQTAKQGALANEAAAWVCVGELRWPDQIASLPQKRIMEIRTLG